MNELIDSNMAKQSKQRKRSLGRAKLALKKIVCLTRPFYNDTRMIRICMAAESGLDKKRRKR